jgi:hypothetical protein
MATYSTTGRAYYDIRITFDLCSAPVIERAAFALSLAVILRFFAYITQIFFNFWICRDWVIAGRHLLGLFVFRFRFALWGG